MRLLICVLLVLFAGCGKRVEQHRFDIIQTAKADGLPDPMSVSFKNLWDFYADHREAAQRMVDGCKTVTIPAADPRRALCGAALLGLHGRDTILHGAAAETPVRSSRAAHAGG